MKNIILIEDNLDNIIKNISDSLKNTSDTSFTKISLNEYQNYYFWKRKVLESYHLENILVNDEIFVANIKLSNDFKYVYHISIILRDNKLFKIIKKLWCFDKIEKLSYDISYKYERNYQNKIMEGAFMNYLLFLNEIFRKIHTDYIIIDPIILNDGFLIKISSNNIEQKFVEKLISSFFDNYISFK